MVQLSHPYMTNGKTIALTRQTFVGKVMSLLFNTLPRYVIGFLQRNNHLLISWLQSHSENSLEPKKIKYVTVSTVSPSICYEVIGLIFFFLVLTQFFFFLTLLFHFHQVALYFFAFCQKSGIICISEITDISPGNLDSSTCFIQTGISHDVLYM